jgi:hypothetical protein
MRRFTRAARYCGRDNSGPIHVRRRLLPGGGQRVWRSRLIAGAGFAAALEQSAAFEFDHKGIEHRPGPGRHEQSRPRQERRHKPNHCQQSPHGAIVEDFRPGLNGSGV